MNIFNSIKMTKPNNNMFDLSHDVKLSLNMGDLVPIMCLETIPGDKFNISCESLLRFAPLVSPVMHRFDVTMHYFFVPNRIIFEGWEKAITGGETLQSPDGGALPYFDVTAANYTPLMDYMGIPTPIGASTERINALPFAAYQKIYNEYYRDQNLIPEVQAANLFEAEQSPSFIAQLGVLRKRAWEHDYFTSSLPFAQKGANVSIPLGQVELKPTWAMDGDQPKFQNSIGVVNDGYVTQYNGGSPTEHIGTNNDPSVAKAYNPDGSLQVEPTTINDLRRAYKLQEWLEKAARGGSRYVESILSHFGVKSSDQRLQRPEYITGTKSPVTISEIVNTTGTSDLPQGNMAGHAVSVTNGQYGNYRCEEHGYIIGIMSVMPKTAYQQGIPKHFLKYKDKFQYYWPSFANIGEQPVENREVYAFQGNDGNETFGYVPRYAEYKYEQNRVAGDFRTTLNFWHEGRIFSNPPALNQEFIECDPDDRIFAVIDPTEHKLYAHVLNKVKAVRPMPKYGTPQF